MVDEQEVAIAKFDVGMGSRDVLLPDDQVVLVSAPYRKKRLVKEVQTVV